MKEYINKVAFFGIAILLLSCAEKKPDYIPYEDYSYLKRQKNHALLVLKLSVDTIYDNVHKEVPTELNNAIKNYDFQIKYRNALAKALKQNSKGTQFYIDDGIKAQDASYGFFPYFGKEYPPSIKKQGYDLILEVNVVALLMFELGYLNFLKRETIRLRDAATNKLYLSSFNNMTKRSVDKFVLLEKDKKRLIVLVEKLATNSATRVSKYLVNKLPKADIENITPLLPELEEVD